MTGLEVLRADHAAAVLAFEVENRAYFASFVSDRGDAYFENFPDHFAALLAEQGAGVCAFHVLLQENGAVLGRFNLYDVADGTADLGYRVAQHATGRGLATAGVTQLCRLAASVYRLQALRAAVADANVASARVLLKAGFVTVGPAAPDQVGGRSGTSYRRDLAARPSDT